ncbi:MAG: alpha/beta hydrolase [Candidatus Nanohaloarchaea archaeon]
MKKVSFENRSGLKLAGNYWESKSDKGVILSHGFTGNKEQFGKFTEIAEELNSEGFNVLSFDYSGHGESERRSITVGNQLEDLEAAFNFIQNEDVDEIGIFGLSFGGLTALEFCRDHHIQALLLLNPLTRGIPDYRERKLEEDQLKDLEESGIYLIEKEHGRFVVPEKTIELKENLDQEELLENIDLPVLVIQGREDETIRFEDSKLASKRLENGDLYVIDDDHYFENSVQEVARKSVEFFSENL